MSTPRQQDIERFLAALGFTQSPTMNGSGNSLVTSTTVTGQCDQFDAYEKIDELQGLRTPFGFYATHDIASGPGYDMLSITFEDIVLSPSGQTVRYNLSTRMINRPIEEHPDYKAVWNHHIVGPKSTALTALEYGYWASRKTPSLPTAITPTTGCHWAKSNQALSPTETIVDVALSVGLKDNSATATKQGVQSYLIPAPVVVATIYTRSETTMENYVALAGTLRAPEKTFGLLTDDKYWLVASPQTKKVNDWYEITVELMYAALGWDEDIY